MIRMKGKVIRKWSSPRSWNKCVSKARRDSGNLFDRFKPFIFPAILLICYFMWVWSDADPMKRVSFASMIYILIGLGVILYLLIVVTTICQRGMTVIRDHGIESGYSGNRLWSPYSSMEWFYIDEDSMEGEVFTFLTWMSQDSNEESFSVLPSAKESVDIRSLLLGRGVREIDDVEYQSLDD
jgi:hypothetical protein